MLAPAAHAADFTVTTLTDENDAGACFPGDAHCSLREAINAANAAPTNDIVHVPAGTFVITRGGVDDTGANGDLDVIDNGTLAISGAGARLTRIHANRKDRILDVHQKANLSVTGVSLLGGDDPTPPPPAHPPFVGGGIRIDGAGASPAAKVSVSSSTISTNHADNGGGVYATNNAELTLTNSTVSGNVAEATGGGIDMVLGGGSTTFSSTNSTISGNQQAVQAVGNGGGGIRNQGTATIDHTTISSNVAASLGGGIKQVSGTFTSKNSIVSGNTASVSSVRNCDAPLTSSGFNVELGTTCGFVQPSDINGDPHLGPLTDNGGPTDTHHPGVASVAIDNADSSGCPLGDQRGVSRPKGGGCDRGSVEAELTDISIAMTDSPDPVANGDTLTYRITVHNLGTAGARGVVVTDHLPSSLRPGTSATSQGVCSDTQNEFCSVGNIPAGGTATIVIRVQAKSVGTVRNTATAFASTKDPNPANNNVTQATSVALRAGPCANRKVGTSASETINGTSKGDLLEGRGGNDRLFGRAGADCLNGGLGNDSLFGGSGEDRVSGGDGNDFVRGGTGKDVLKGGNGKDTIYAVDGQRDTIDCGPGTHDKATIDSHDSVKNCETVILK